MDMSHMDHMAPAGNDTMTMATECDGSIDPSRKGSWQGHILPGSIFVVWGAWWAYNICLCILRSTASRPYAAQPWYRLGIKRLALVEPLLKVLGPPIAISVELYWDHEAYRYLFCPEGTKWAGRFAVTHMNNWQHTSIYPGFILSGITDLLCLAGVPLPPGTGHGVLSLAFGVMTFLMGMHKKHEQLDAAVHGLLFVAMLFVTISMWAELAKPRSPGLGLVRAATTIFLGAWLCEVGIIEFDALPRWSTDYMGSSMFAPVVFAMIALLVVSALLMFYSTLATLLKVGLLPALPPPVYGSGADGSGQPSSLPVFAESNPLLPSSKGDGRGVYGSLDSARRDGPDGNDTIAAERDRRAAVFQIDV